MIKILLITVLLCGTAFSQDHSHTDDSFERFELARVLPPAKILYVEPTEAGLKFDYSVTAKSQVKYGSFITNRHTGIHADALKKGKLVWIMYCSVDNFLYALAEVSPTQTRK